MLTTDDEPRTENICTSHTFAVRTQAFLFSRHFHPQALFTLCIYLLPLSLACIGHMQANRLHLMSHYLPTIIHISNKWSIELFSFTLYHIYRSSATAHDGPFELHFVNCAENPTSNQFSQFSSIFPSFMYALPICLVFLRYTIVMLIKMLQ